MSFRGLSLAGPVEIELGPSEAAPDFMDLYLFKVSLEVGLLSNSVTTVGRVVRIEEMFVPESVLGRLWFDAWSEFKTYTGSLGSESLEIEAGILETKSSANGE